ncbi:MAG TPA: hypothetical protein DD471_07360, partial [Planctomycetes bacterium]|nr:hypothetical protein [Planctomycetota bacterium]
MVEDMLQLARRRLSIEKILLLGIGLFLAVFPPVFSQEENEVADFNEDKWTLEMTPLKIRMVTPRIGVGKGRTFWYMVYSLENKSGA